MCEVIKIMNYNVMIVQPMRGLTKEEILAVRKDATNFLESLGYNVLNTYFDRDISEKEINAPIYLLSKAIEVMSRCDTVYFCLGWHNARGCRAEYEIAKNYGLNMIFEKPKNINYIPFENFFDVYIEDSHYATRIPYYVV